METEEQRETRANTLARERQAAAILLAEQRGKETAQIHAQLENHEKRLNVINGSIERSAKAKEALADQVAALAAAFHQNQAVAEARAEDAKTAAAKQVSVRQFYFGLIGAVSAIGAILATTSHL